MSNWAYTLDVPTSPWRTAMTVPRSLTLRRTSAGWRLAQTPVEELRILREEPALEFSGGSFAAADLWLYQRSDLNELLDVEMTFSEVFPSAPFVINIHTGIAEVTAIAIDPSEGKLTIDRMHSGHQRILSSIRRFLQACRATANCQWHSQDPISLGYFVTRSFPAGWRNRFDRPDLPECGQPFDRSVVRRRKRTLPAQGGANHDT
jgi:sucrose-6-phosphate hydrolase SacC (GH32 family)